jgi:hypothetical protein
MADNDRSHSHSRKRKPTSTLDEETGSKRRQRQLTFASGNTPTNKNSLSRLLHVSGLDITTSGTGRELMGKLNEVMRKKKLCAWEETPIVDCHMKRHYAFLVFVNPDMVTLGLKLNGQINYHGRTLKFERTNKSFGESRDVHSSRTTPSIEDALEEDIDSCSSSDNNYIDETSLDRRLHVGGLTAGRGQELVGHLNNAMRTNSLCARHESPVVGCEFHGKYAFVILGNAEMATLALNLNGKSYYHGSALKLNRERKTISNQIERQEKGSVKAWSVNNSIDYYVDQTLFVSDFNPELINGYLKTEVSAVALLKEFFVYTLHLIGSPSAQRSQTIVDCELIDGKKGSYVALRFSTPAAANEALVLDNVPFMGSNLSVQRPNRYEGPKDDNIDWDALLNHRASTSKDTPFWDAFLSPKRDKSNGELTIDHEIFIGKLAPDMNEDILNLFLGSSMVQAGLIESEGSPITKCDIHGTYAIIQLRTPQEATNALCLNNIPFMCRSLVVVRRKQWQGDLKGPLDWADVLGSFKFTHAFATPKHEEDRGREEDMREMELQLEDARKDVELSREESGAAKRRSEETIRKMELQLDNTRKESEVTLEELRALQQDSQEDIRSTERRLQDIWKDLQLTREEKSSLQKQSEEEILAMRLRLNNTWKDFELVQEELRTSQQLLSEYERDRKLLNFNKDSLETVNRKWGETWNELKLTRQQLDSTKQQVVQANDEVKQMKANMGSCASSEVKAMEELKTKNEELGMRNQRILESLTNAMDELIIERRGRRDLEQSANAQKEATENAEKALEYEKSMREYAEKEVERLKAELYAAVKNGSRPVKKDETT